MGAVLSKIFSFLRDVGLDLDYGLLDSLWATIERIAFVRMMSLVVSWITLMLMVPVVKGINQNGRDHPFIGLFIGAITDPALMVGIGTSRGFIRSGGIDVSEVVRPDFFTLYLMSGGIGVIRGATNFFMVGFYLINLNHRYRPSFVIRHN